MNFHVRHLVKSDMPEVLEIETSGFDYPWLEDEFLRTLQRRECFGFAAEHDGRLAGFMIYELGKRKLVLLSLAVHDSFRRHGVGRQLIEKLSGKLGSKRRKITTNVHEENVAAQVFFRECGFIADKTVSDYSPELRMEFTSYRMVLLAGWDRIESERALEAVLD